MQNLLSILFFIKKSKNKNATHATVYLRITYDGRRAELSTMRKVSLSKWNAKANKVSGSSVEAKQVNRNLDIIKNRIYEIYQRLLDNEEDISAEKIKNEYSGNNNMFHKFKVFGTTLYQSIPETNGDLHVISTEGDRLDNLAFQFYGDSSLWWYIAKANNLTAMNVPAGKSLRIPASADGAIGG